MANSTLPHSQKGIGTGILPPSTHSSQSMTHPLLRNASAYRNHLCLLNPTHPNNADLSFHKPSSTAKVPYYGEFWNRAKMML